MDVKKIERIYINVGVQEFVFKGSSFKIFSSNLIIIIIINDGNNKLGCARAHGIFIKNISTTK